MGWVVDAASRRFTPGKTRCPLYKRLCGPQCRYGQVNVAWGGNNIYHWLRNSSCGCITYLRPLQIPVHNYHIISATFPQYRCPILSAAKGENSNQLFFFNFIYLSASLTTRKTTLWSHVGVRKLKLLPIRNLTALKWEMKIYPPLTSVRGNTLAGHRTPIASSPSL